MKSIKLTIAMSVFVASITICSQVQSLASSKIGEYVSTTIYVDNGKKATSRNIIDLLPNGVATLRSPHCKIVRGHYSIKGNIITFNFKDGNVIDQSGRFIKTALFTNLINIPEGDDPPEGDPSHPFGHAHLKMR